MTLLTTANVDALEELGWRFMPTGPNEWEWLKFDDRGVNLARQGCHIWEEDMAKITTLDDASVEAMESLGWEFSSGEGWHLFDKAGRLIAKAGSEMWFKDLDSLSPEQLKGTQVIETQTGPVTQPWTWKLTLKQQTVLLSALRGCDGVPKDDLSKPLVRALRAVVLHNAVEGDCSFMPRVMDVESLQIDKFLKAMDHYPMHWLMHFLHAAECVGYGHPLPLVAAEWLILYTRMCDALHVRHETKDVWNLRLIDGPPSDCWKA